MNTQRKVVITTTYNEMGIIIDTKAEEVAQPNLQPTCNQLATDTINRQAAIDALRAMQTYKMFAGDDLLLIDQAGAQTELMMLPSVQPERKTGRWIHQAKFGRVECDQCGKVFRNTFAPKNFCPNCGADMRDEQRLQYVDSDTLQGGLMSAT